MQDTWDQPRRLHFITVFLGIKVQNKTVMVSGQSACCSASDPRGKTVYILPGGAVFTILGCCYERQWPTLAVSKLARDLHQEISADAVLLNYFITIGVCHDIAPDL